ncbi:regulator of G-protein signaling 12, partial [Salmo trutta]|uniref:regulator of G-protein signaling 12 n=1 Tax=Salmo trutta TaxID=8032 RepID=UPI00113243F0
MFRQTDTSSKRRHGGLTTLPSPPHPHQGGRIRGVEVARGRAGYGFTLSGQGPCVLNCILKGSPADYVGLRSGDHILSVNDINVSKASHEDVVKLIGRCTGVLHLVVAEGDRGGPAADSCSSDEELCGFHNRGGGWFKPKLDSKTLGINRAERVVAEMQSGEIFNMIFDNSSHSSSSSERASSSSSASTKPARPLSEPEFPPYHKGRGRSHSNPNLLSEEEMDRVLMSDDSVFLDGFHLQEAELQVEVEGEDFCLEPSEGILNVGMMVGYLGSIELASTGASLESDSLQAIRGSMRRLRAEQKIHSLVLMKVMHDCVRLCSDRRQVLATYPAEKLAFSACCPDDRRFFGLVTMQATHDDDGHYGNGNREEEGGLRTSCHVFIVDPELCHHQFHVGVARRFGFECTPDPDTGGCLEFPPTSQPLLQFVSVLYRDMGENIEGVRARAFVDPDNDPQQNHSTSSNSDSGIGNFLPEEKSNRVLLVDLGGHNHNPGPRHWDSPPPPSAPGWNQVPPGVVPGPPLPPPPPPRGAHPSLHHYPPGKRGGRGGGPGGVEQSLAQPQHHQSQRWLPVHVLRDWRQPGQAGQTQGQGGLCSDQESYAESTDGWSSANCSTLPPPMNKIPADRYRAPLPAGDLPLPPQPPRLATQKDEWAKKLFVPGAAAGEKGLREPKQNGKRRGNGKDEEKKAGRFRGLTKGFPALPQRSSGRRSFGRSKRISLARSLDDLE